MTERLLKTGVALAVVGAGLQAVVHLFNLFALDRRYYQLDASGEGTAFAWASTMATFAAALGALFWAGSDQRVRGRAVLLAALLTYFSFDDFVQVHERFGQDLADAVDLPEAVGVRIWILIYLPLLGLAAYIVWTISVHTMERIRRFQLGAIALLAAGVVSEGAGILTKALEERGFESPHVVRAGLEEAVELAGWTVLTAALFAAAYGNLTAAGARETGSRPGSSPSP